MIAIAIQRPGDGKIDATTKTDVATGFLAVTNIVFAYGRLFHKFIAVYCALLYANAV